MKHAYTRRSNLNSKAQADMWNVLTCEIHDVFSAPWFQHSYEYGLLHLTTVIMEISISSWKKTRQEFCSESNILSLCCVWLCKQLVTTTWSLLFGFFHGKEGLNCDIQTAGVVNSQEPYQLRKYEYGVKSKETVGNSWTVLKVILGHKYHHNH